MSRAQRWTFTGSGQVALLDAAQTLTFAQLNDFGDRLDAALAASGAPRSSVVASSLDSDIVGAAVAASAVRSWSYAPQNPSLRRIQLADRFARLGASALVVAGHDESRATTEAANEGMAVIRIDTDVPSLAEAAITVEVPMARQGPCISPEVALLLPTSGTTSAPRMVPISVSALRASTANMARAFCLEPMDRSLCILPMFHVHSAMASVLVPLLHGASVACPGLYNAPAFLGWLTEFEPTYYSAVPTVHQSIVDRLETHPEELRTNNLRFVRSTSGALAPKSRKRLEAKLGVPVVEGYAMTEATSQVSTNPLGDAVRKDFSVGPSVGPEIRIVDDRGATLPSGSIGTIELCGESIVDGYLNDPESTRESFSDKWLHTGDLGYLDDDGYLFLTGRTKDVIRRGAESVAPSEIEACLLEHPMVHSVIVFAVPDTRLGEQVAAAVTVGGDVDEAELRSYVFRRRAPYEVPRRILLVDQLPVAGIGKLDRSGLAERYGLAELDHREAEQGTAPPRTHTERVLLAAWEDVLGTTVPGIDHHFFELGGDSLLVKSLLLRVNAEWGVEAPFLEFFDALTVAAQAELIDQLMEAGEVKQAEVETPPTSADEPFALSRAQERLWILEQIDPGQASYHIAWRTRISGDIDVMRLEQAFTGVIARHEALRTRVLGLQADRPMQQVAAPGPFSLELAELPADGAALGELIDAHHRRPFDLAHDDLIRALLLSADSEHVLAVTVHHLAADGRSLEIFSRELTAEYQSTEGSNLPVLEKQYRDFVAWEGLRESSHRYEHDLDQWADRFVTIPEPLNLPYDRMPDRPPGGPAGSCPIALDDVAGGDLRALCRETRSTPFMVMMASLVDALGKLAGDTDVCIGTPTEDRAWAPATPLIGYFVNTLPLRVNAGGNPTFPELVKRVRHVALDAYQMSAVSFDDVVSRVNPARRAAHSPLYDVMLTAAVGDTERPQFGKAMLRPMRTDTRRVKFSLEVDFRVVGDAVRGSLSYDTRWFDTATGALMADAIAQSLRDGIAKPDLS